MKFIEIKGTLPRARNRNKLSTHVVIYPNETMSIRGLDLRSTIFDDYTVVTVDKQGQKNPRYMITLKRGNS
jgi:hypothetical protein